MRVVVDTNVFVSAALKGSSTPALALRSIARRGGLLKSAATERQLLEVLARPRLAALIAPEAFDWLRRLLADAERVLISERIAECRDPTDDKFLELAVEGHADMIVSGDADLLVLTRSVPFPSYRPPRSYRSRLDRRYPPIAVRCDDATRRVRSAGG